MAVAVKLNKKSNDDAFIINYIYSISGTSISVVQATQKLLNTGVELTGPDGGILVGFSGVRSGPGLLNWLPSRSAAASALNPPLLTSFSVSCKLISFNQRLWVKFMST